MPADALNGAAQLIDTPEHAQVALLAFLKDQLKRERARVDQLEAQVERAEGERDAARIRSAAMDAELQAARQQADQLAAAHRSIRQELVAWTSGGPLVRAWRAFWYQRR
ncbi:hypothetical protein [Paracraurococcus lichenis]|uniref:Uncharacterized protein n=1 Tax=Paracraurococcus lichenis TaxID=3064888 RepID=A0ABT9ED27_9PROT|nr:hypothetical protein [Paracraurococcus sp. LOR1-02]MDO9714114.1 hypothetical protein [Paracraurococcus sp. LOR1-02]